MTEEIERSNQERTRTPEEKKTYKYLGILEADTKQKEMKEIKKKKVSQMNEKTSRNQALQ